MPRRVKQIILRSGAFTVKNGNLFSESVNETRHQIHRTDFTPFADYGDIWLLAVHVQLTNLDRKNFVNSG